MKSLRSFYILTSILGLITLTSASVKAFNPTPTNQKSGGTITGIYTLLADDSDQHYKSNMEWSPSLHSYQREGFNTLFFTFIRPDTMQVPKSFANFASNRASNIAGSIPENTKIIFSIGGIAYSTQINPWPWLRSEEAAREMARQVAEWPRLYGCDGIDIDIEEGAGHAPGAGRALIAFVQELKRLNPEMLVTLPVYGFPQVPAANELVNAAFGPDGTDHGLLDLIGIMVYEDTQALNYVGNYAKLPGQSRWEGFPITADVPKDKILLGLKGTASDSSIRQMAQAVQDRGLGGYMVWYGSLLDEGKTGLQYPPSWDASTIKTPAWQQAQNQLGHIQIKPAQASVPEIEKPGSEADYTKPNNSASRDQKVSVAYFTSWSIYGRNYFVSDIPASKLTHINYAFVNVTSDLRCALGDFYADIDKSFDGNWSDDKLRGNFGELLKLKEANPHLKTLLALGGWTWSTYFSLAARPENREAFVDSCVKLMNDYGFDGIDLDWEYPVAGGLDSNHRSPEDKKNYVELVRTFREKMGQDRLLTVATTAGDDKVDNLDLPGMARYIDWFNVMTYDFNGGWDPITNHNAPLYGPQNETYTMDYAINLYLKRGVPRNQIVAGLAFYGRGRSQVASGPNGDGLLQPAGGRAQGTWEAEVFDYKDLARNYINRNGFRSFWDDHAKVPYLYNSDQGIFISYDDPRSIAIKVDYIRKQDLRGLMVWSIDADNGDLMKTAHERLFAGSPYQSTHQIVLRAKTKDADLSLIPDSNIESKE